MKCKMLIINVLGLALIAVVQGMDGSSTKLRTVHGDSIPGISKIKDIIIYKDSIGYTWAVQFDENRASNLLF